MDDAEAAKRPRDEGEAAAPEPDAKQARADGDAAADAAPAADAAAPAGATAPGRTGGKKRKVVVMVGYVGVGYQGMQRNPGVKTIEDELERAFHAAGGISDDNQGDFSKVSWTRAARTDKGVSAVGQVVALKMLLEPPGLIERINAALPANFRAFGVTRVITGFNAKNLCDRRRYKYVLPEWAFDPSTPLPASATPSGGLLLDDAQLAARHAFRLGDTGLARLNALLSHFVGTHNFHNYTIRVRADAPSARRYILAFAAAPPAEAHGERLVTLQVLGQSFMLHQIRKMVGTALAVMRGQLSEIHLRDALTSHEAIATPMAPELGLYLAECVFHAYNERWQDSHPPLALSNFDPAPAEFERDYILAHIVAEEAKSGVLATWLRALNERAARGEAARAGNDAPSNGGGGGGGAREAELDEGEAGEADDDAGGGAEEGEGGGGSDSEGARRGGGGGGGGRGRGGGRGGGRGRGGGGWRGRGGRGRGR